jgi:hypothetical protein
LPGEFVVEETDKSLDCNIFSFASLRPLRKNIADISNLGELQCVSGEYISPAATSDPPLDRVPALPVEFNTRPTFGLLRSFFSFF